MYELCWYTRHASSTNQVSWSDDKSRLPAKKAKKVKQVVLRWNAEFNCLRATCCNWRTKSGANKVEIKPITIVRFFHAFLELLAVVQLSFFFNYLWNTYESLKFKLWRWKLFQSNLKQHPRLYNTLSYLPVMNFGTCSEFILYRARVESNYVNTNSWPRSESFRSPFLWVSTIFKLCRIY